jgi:uncharacterized protein YneF (UPF0154 family)
MNTITFNYTRDDVLKAFELHFAKKFPLRSRLMLILGAAVLIGSLVQFIVPFIAYPNMKWILLLMGVFYIGFYFYRKRIMVNLAMKNPTIADMGSMEFSLDKIRFSGEKGASEQVWSNFIDLIEDENSLLLYISKQNFFILPKRCFSDEDLNLIRSSMQKDNAN